MKTQSALFCRIALLFGVAALTACADKTKLDQVVSPKSVTTSAAQTNTICAYPRPTQNGTDIVGRVYYVPGQKMRIINGLVLGSGCNTPNTCEVWLTKGGEYVATLATGHNPNATGSSFDVTLPTGLFFGEDYNVQYYFSNGDKSGVMNPITIYVEKAKLMTVAPSGLTYNNSSTVVATWPGNAWPAGHPVDVYVYGFGPLLADNTRTKMGTVSSPGSGSATLSFAAPASGGSFSATRQWIVRVQDGTSDILGNMSLVKNTTN